MDLIVVMTPRGDIRYLSPALRRLLALHDQATRDDLAALLHPDDLRTLRSLITAEDRPWPRTARVRLGQGPHWRELALEADDRRHDPTFGGYVITARDLTADRLRRTGERTDALTGLPNRLVFIERLRELMSQGPADRLAVLMLDLDGFRMINHSLGHGAGDTLLVQVVERMTRATDEQVFLARLGGDEFGVLYRYDTPAAPEDLASKLLRPFAQPFPLGELEVDVRCSVGIALNRTGIDAERLLQAADTALYDAKSDGRHRVSTYTPLMGLAVRERLALRSSLPRALERDEFELWYQPIVDLTSRRLVSFEALARCHSPEHGVVSPAQFVPLAEESGFIVELGRWALEAACAQLARWRTEHASAASLSVAVNVSSRQLDEARFTSHIAEALLNAGLPAESLTIEVTESLILSDLAMRRLGALRELGVGLAIDDFGTGHSSLGRLQRLQVHVLKLDRSFVSPLGAGNQSGIAFLRSIVHMASSLGLRTVAEGVETHDHLSLVERAGLDQAQGYLFGRPAPASAFTQLLRSAEHPVLLPDAAPQAAPGA